jgi:zinc transport system substrate-binding protein
MPSENSPMRSRAAVATCLIAGAGLACGGSAAAGPAPAVVVSIKPIQSLVGGVMDGIGAPQLLIEGAGSPHSFALRPSQARALAEADVVFWVGEDLEAFLARPLAALSDDATVVALSEADGLRLLATREGGMRSGAGEAAEEHAEHHAGHDDVHEHEEHEHGAVDMHLWLDPQNGAAMAGAIAATLSAIDPERASAYQANATRIRADLAELDAELAAALAPVRNRPFVVSHDAYQYFEARYGLNAVGSITVDPQRTPGAARLREIRAELEKTEAGCVFAEPQFRPALVETVVEGTGAATGVLDPLGADLAAGPGQYAELLRRLARSLVECLSPAGPG